LLVNNEQSNGLLISVETPPDKNARMAKKRFTPVLLEVEYWVE
jgi:hypothetical protein